MFGTVNLIKNADLDMYSYSGYGLGFNARETLLLSDGSGFGKNLIKFGADMSSSMHTGNKKHTLVFRKGPTDGLGDTTLTTEKEYSINFTEQQKKTCLSSHYNGSNSYIFANCVKIYKFKVQKVQR